jgi:hypothetical protein
LINDPGGAPPRDIPDPNPLLNTSVAPNSEVWVSGAGPNPLSVTRDGANFVFELEEGIYEKMYC